MRVIDALVRSARSGAWERPWGASTVGRVRRIESHLYFSPTRLSDPHSRARSLVSLTLTLPDRSWVASCASPAICAPPGPRAAARDRSTLLAPGAAVAAPPKLTVIRTLHDEYEPPRSRVWSLRSRSPRSPRGPGRQRERSIRRARGPPGRAGHAIFPLCRPGPRFPLHVLHGGPQVLGGRRLQSDLRGASVSAFSRHPGRARLGRFVPHVGPDAQSAPHSREP